MDPVQAFRSFWIYLKVQIQCSYIEKNLIMSMSSMLERIALLLS
jgi:hypothetical protein